MGNGVGKLRNGKYWISDSHNQGIRILMGWNRRRHTANSMRFES